MPDMNCYNINCPSRIKGFIRCCGDDKQVGDVPDYQTWTVRNCPKYIKDRRGEGLCAKCGNQIAKFHEYYFNEKGRFQHRNCELPDSYIEYSFSKDDKLQHKFCKLPASYT